MNFKQKNVFGVAAAKFDGVSTSPPAENRRAIVLAGGNDFSFSDGLIPAGLRGQRPRHFCRTTGGEFLINRTRKRIEKLFAPEEIMFVVTEDHKRYYEEVLSDVRADNLIVQPQDDGTTLAVLYTALRMAITAPSAILTFFPADFYAKDAEEFMRRIESACVVARRELQLILLGVKSDDEQARYEWIELDPSAPVDKNFNVWRVRRFLARATKAQTQELTNNGALANSLVMVGTPSTFLRKIRRAAPDVWERFSLAAERIGTPSERRAVQAAYYSQHPYTDFSRDVLEKSAEKLLVVPVPVTLETATGINSPSIAKISEKPLKSGAPKIFAAGFGA